MWSKSGGGSDVALGKGIEPEGGSSGLGDPKLY